MKVLLICFFAFTTLSSLTAQTENTWRGGFPGQERDWDVDQNWSLNRIPNEFDIAVIPDCSARGGFYPIVWIEQPTIQGLWLLSGARLDISKGAILAVDSGDPTYSGVLLQGELRNEGRLIIVNTDPGTAQASVVVRRSGQ